VSEITPKMRSAAEAALNDLLDDGGAYAFAQLWPLTNINFGALACDHRAARYRFYATSP
jgi:hypothetical protein